TLRIDQRPDRNGRSRRRDLVVRAQHLGDSMHQIAKIDDLLVETDIGALEIDDIGQIVEAARKAEDRPTNGLRGLLSLRLLELIADRRKQMRSRLQADERSAKIRGDSRNELRAFLALLVDQMSELAHHGIDLAM